MQTIRVYFGYLYLGILLLESHCSAEFSSEPAQTQLNQLIEVFRSSRNYQAVFCSKLGQMLALTIGIIVNRSFLVIIWT